MFEQKFDSWIKEVSVKNQGMVREAAVRAMVEEAERQKARVLGGQPKPSGYRQIVDNIEGRALTEVKPDGVIIFTWQYLGEVVEATYNMLIQASPVRSGDFVKNIEIRVNGERVASGFTNLERLNIAWTNETRVMLVATARYSHRLEVGKKKNGEKFVIQAEYRFMEKTKQAAQRLYGDLANFEYQHVELTDGYKLRRQADLMRRSFHGDKGWRYSSTKRLRFGKVEDHVRYPAIIITPKIA